MTVTNPSLKSEFDHALGVSEDLLEKLNEGIIFVDHTDVIRFANKKFLELTDGNEIEGKNPLDICHQNQLRIN